MGFKSVYRALFEVFPQVDARILKAVAIEHSKDANSAVEFILLEVLPFMSKQSDGQFPSIDYKGPRSSKSRKSKFTVECSSTNSMAVEEAVAGPSSSQGTAVGMDAATVDHMVDDLRGDSALLDGDSLGSSISNFYKANDSHDHACGNACSGAGEDSQSCQSNIVKAAPKQAYVGSPLSLVLGNFEGNVNLNDLCTAVSEVTESLTVNHGNSHTKETPSDINLNGLCASVSEESMTVNHGHNDAEEVPSDIIPVKLAISPTAQFPDFPECSLPREGMPYKNAHDSFGNCEDVNNGCTVTLNNISHADITHFSEAMACGFDTAINGDSVHGSPITDTGKQHFSVDITPEDGNSSGEDHLEDSASASSSAVSGSSQMCRIGFLEDMIEDSKNNKKTLFLAVESVVNLMREVEREEKAAEQAQDEACEGVVGILARVQDMKQMLQRAKEANDMHAGEVHGEKAILATESRELQVRLSNLSDERDKSLAILDEMRQMLEIRLATAAEVKKAAEQKKQEKEISARAALAEQELVMEKAVMESKMLHQEAEENSMLRDFLVDRGHLVDTLQGEISVICQDVKLLKEKFDERVPLSQSLSSSQTSCILASSNPCLKAILSGRVNSPEPYKSRSPSRSSRGGDDRTRDCHMVPQDAVFVWEGDPSWPCNGRSPSACGDGGAGDSVRTTLSDDGWELFDKDVVVGAH